MKRSKLFLFTTFLILSFASNIFSQNLDRFLKYDGVKIAAGMAHPLNTYQKGYYTVYSDYALLDIYYEDGIRTQLKVWYSNGYFYRIDVLHNGDSFPSFMAVGFLKDILVQLLKEADADERQIVSDFEKWLNKKLDKFSGKDLTLAVLTIAWLSYQ